MSFQFYNIVFSFIGLLYCLHGQVNGHLTPIIYLLEETFENSVDGDFNPMMPIISDNNNNIKFWNKESGIYDFGFKELQHLPSSINLRKKFLLKHLSQILSAKYPNKKPEENILKRFPRQANTNQDIDSTQTTTVSTITASNKGIENEKMSTLNPTSTSYSTSTIISSENPSVSTTSHSVPSNISSDQSLGFKNSSSISMDTSSASDLALKTTTDLPSDSSSIIVPTGINTTQSIKTLSGHLPTEQKERNYLSVTIIFLGISIISIGLFIAYKKYQYSTRHACYQMGDMCRNNVEEETPV